MTVSWGMCLPGCSERRGRRWNNSMATRSVHQAYAAVQPAALAAWNLPRRTIPARQTADDVDKLHDQWPLQTHWMRIDNEGIVDRPIQEL